MTHSKSEQPAGQAAPRHVAIIMDGNGRWAKRRLLPRVAGHKRGVETVRAVIRASLAAGVEYLTLFAFSSENWRRPQDEVSFLMELFMRALEGEVRKLHEQNVRFRVIGDTAAFNARLQQLIRDSEALTAANTGMTLVVAANYGGRWDILQAVNRMTAEHPERRGAYTEAQLSGYLSLADIPEPDLFIRTGGETRLSNFLLWQLAYAELYFTDTLWPDFDAAAYQAALAAFAGRERRFGRTSEQVRGQAQ